VQNLARILTGVGINAGGPQPKLKPAWQGLYRRDGAFEFNPARHDFGSKILLGHAIRGQGFAEVEQAVHILVREPACAQFISRKLAVYFVADDPPPALVARMAATFSRTDGDIGAVLRVMFAAPEFSAALGGKFKDPMHFVVSTMRLAYDARPILNTHPVVNWLNALAEPLYGHQTPDGYALTEAAWASSGQMSRRFEIARAMAAPNAALFEPEEGSIAPAQAFRSSPTRSTSPRSSRCCRSAPRTRSALRPRSRNGIRCCSPRLSSVTDDRLSARAPRRIYAASRPAAIGRNSSRTHPRR
jgi:uncharacterized protein (DUF1800 family)